MGDSTVFKLGLKKKDKVDVITPDLIREINAAERAGGSWLRHKIPQDIALTLGTEGKLAGKHPIDLGSRRRI